MLELFQEFGSPEEHIGVGNERGPLQFWFRRGMFFNTSHEAAEYPLHIKFPKHYVLLTTTVQEIF